MNHATSLLLINQFLTKSSVELLSGGESISLFTVYLVCQLANSKRMHPNNLHAVVLSARKTLCVLQYYSTQDKSALVVYPLSAFVTTFIPLLCSCNMLC